LLLIELRMSTKPMAAAMPMPAMPYIGNLAISSNHFLMALLTNLSILILHFRTAFCDVLGAFVPAFHANIGNCLINILGTPAGRHFPVILAMHATKITTIV
jgi:hypothetical protein